MKRYWILGAVTAAVIATVCCIVPKTAPQTANTVSLAPQTAVRTELCPATVTDAAHLQTFVPERLANVVKTGQSVTVSGAGFAEQQYTGTVTSVSKEATVKGGKTGLATIVTLRETDESIKKGLSAAVYLTIATYENAIVLREAWLQHDGDGWTVFLAENGKAVRRPVTLLQPVDGGVTATGLPADAHVITNPRAVTANQPIQERVTA